MVEFNLFSLFGVSIHFHVHWPDRTRNAVPVVPNEANRPVTLSPSGSRAHAIIDFNWFVRHPITGDLVPVKNIPPQAAARLIEHLRPAPR